MSNIVVKTEVQKIVIKNADGRDGKSAYQQAVEGGYTGSEQEFNCSLSLLADVEDIKKRIADAINYKGGEATPNEAFTELAEDIKDIPNFDQWARLAGVLAGNSYGKNALQGHNENVAAGGITKLTDYLGTFTRLNTSAFQYWDLLEDVELPNLDTIVSNSNFQSCTSLQSVEFKNLTTISGHDTFRGCSSLKSIEIPNLATISGSGTFISCSSLQSVQFPNLITISSSLTFHFCESLQQVIFGTLIQCSEPFSQAKPNIRNITIGQNTNIDLPFQQWTATNVIAEGQSGIDELNSNLRTNLLEKLYDHSQDGETRTLRIGWLANVSEDNIAYATDKGWTLTT